MSGTAFDIIQPLIRAAHWLNSLADDGPDLRVNAHLKAAHEAAELAANPTPEEWADVAICLVGTALGQGWSVETLTTAVSQKVDVNTARTWSQEPDGTWQHVTPPPLCGGDHDEAGIEDCDACQAEVLEPGCSPGCRACRDDGREYRWAL